MKTDCADTTDRQPSTEELILQAAEKVFLDKGYAGAKTTDIATEAGVTHAMLHYYYRTKDKLFERIVTEKMNKLGETMMGTISNIDPAASLEECLKQIVECHFDFISANRDVPRFLVNEIHVHPERMEFIKQTIKSKVSRLTDELQAMIDGRAAKGECRQVDARMLVIDMASLNLFPFLAASVLSPVVEIVFGNYEAFLEERRKENVRTILEKLKLR